MKTSIEPFIRCTLNGPAMGSRWSAAFYTRNPAKEAALQTVLAAAVDKVDAQMSTWSPTSDLMRLNAAAVGIWVTVPPELCTVLETALQIGRDSGGAFDMGVGDLVAGFGFGAQAIPARPGRLPQPKKPRARTSDILELDLASQRVRKNAPVVLDLSGIAKGYGVDQLGAVLDDFGIGSWLVGIDGEMRSRGVKPDGSPWVIALEQPEPGARRVRSVIALTDRAAATTGDYRHFVDLGDTRLTHTMHPLHGEPVRNRIASVTVLARTCMEADAWATALMVLGDQTGPVIARITGLDALFVLRIDQSLVEIAVGATFGQQA